MASRKTLVKSKAGAYVGAESSSLDQNNRMTRAIAQMDDELERRFGSSAPFIDRAVTWRDLAGYSMATLTLRDGTKIQPSYVVGGQGDPIPQLSVAKVVASGTLRAMSAPYLFLWTGSAGASMPVLPSGTLYRVGELAFDIEMVDPDYVKRPSIYSVRARVSRVYRSGGTAGSGKAFTLTARPLFARAFLFPGTGGETLTQDEVPVSIAIHLECYSGNAPDANTYGIQEIDWQLLRAF